MIYDDRPLAQEGVRTSKWDGKWDPQTLSSKYVTHSMIDQVIGIVHDLVGLEY